MARSAALLLLCLGCGFADNGIGGFPDGGTDGSPSDAPGGCQVVLTATPSPPYLAPVSVVVSAQVVGGVPPLVHSFSASAGTLVPRTDGVSAIFSAPVPDAYQVTDVVRGFTGDVCSQTLTLNVMNPTGVPGLVRLRFTPASAALPQQEVLQAVTGGSPQAGLLFPLSPGIPVTLRPVDPGGVAVSAYVRATDTTTGVRMESYVDASAAAPTLRLLDHRFDLRVVPVPDRADLAPTALQLDGAALGIDGRLPLAPGVAVAGQVAVSDGGATAGFQVELSGMSVPSSVGRVATDTGFSVRAQPGAYALRIAPAPGSTLPRAQSRDGLISVGAQIAPHIGFTYDAPTLVRFGAVLTQPDGTPAAGARIHLSAALLRVGVLALDGTAPIPIAGGVDRDLVADATGATAIVLVPAGSYDLMVEAAPGSGAARTRVRGLQLDVDRLGFAISLSRPVGLRGRVVAGTPATPVAGAVIQAFERGLPAVFAARTSDDGQFALEVDPDTTYDLVITPPVTSSLTRLRAPVAIARAAMTVPDFAIVHGISLAGQVVDPAGAPAPGTLIEAFCLGCADPSAAIADAAADGAGQFVIIVTDPM
jgi:hypothetical protein